MKKIMIFYAAYGGGHLSAARSIKENIETKKSLVKKAPNDRVSLTLNIPLSLRHNKNLSHSEILGVTIRQSHCLEDRHKVGTVTYPM